MDFNFELLVILGLVAFFAGFMDAIAGGGGLITLPTLLISGIDPISAIATNKFQAASATVSSVHAFAKKGMIDWKKSIPLGCAAFFGGMSGALFVSVISKELLQGLVPIMLVMVAIYFTLSPRLEEHKNKEKISLIVFSFTIAPLLGFYDGVFGPGVGSFFMVAFVFFTGFSFMKSMSFTKIANASCNLGSLSIFIVKGSIIWPVALVMAVASFIGAQLGIRCVVKVGPKFVKPMLIVVCFLLAAKLISASDNPLRIYLQGIFFS